jgi:hypothetical protein
MLCLFNVHSCESSSGLLPIESARRPEVVRSTWISCLLGVCFVLFGQERAQLLDPVVNVEAPSSLHCKQTQNGVSECEFEAVSAERTAKWPRN